MNSLEERYNKAGQSAKLGVPIKVTRSKNFSPGGIFTLGTDFKTREWSSYRIDDIDASSTPFLPKFDISSTNSRAHRQVANCHDLIIPADISVRQGEVDSQPKNKIPIKIAKAPPKEIVTENVDNSMDNQSQASSSQSVHSHSTRSIFGRGNPMKSYSFKGTKLCRNRLEKLDSRAIHHYPITQPFDDDSLHSFESIPSQSMSKQSLNELVNKSSQDESEINTDWPAHQIHSRMMGWKLTSPERRRDLLRMLERANLSTASMSEEELQDYKKKTDDKKMRKIKLVAKRQAEAYERSVSRLALCQNKVFKFSMKQLDNIKVKVLNVSEGEDVTDKVIRPCSRKLDIFKDERIMEDPFANVEVERAFTAEVAKTKRQLDIDKREKELKVSAIEIDEGAKNEMEVPIFFQNTSPTQRRIQTPKFQTVDRDQRILLNPADRMELLSNARDVETTTTTNVAAESFTGGQTNFIGTTSPKRGLTGEAYLLSMTKGMEKQNRKPVQFQTGWT